MHPAHGKYEGIICVARVSTAHPGDDGLMYPTTLHQPREAHRWPVHVMADDSPRIAKLARVSEAHPAQKDGG